MITLRGHAAILLRYIGVTDFDPASNLNELNQRGLNSQDIADVTACLNGAVQEAYTLAPADEIQRQVGGAIRPPASITLSVTQYATACTITGYLDWMLGCTVRISGDDNDNRIVSSTELMRPFMGSTAGSASATVYADCLTIPAAYEAIIEPVRLSGFCPLVILKDRESFEHFNASPVYTGSHQRSPVSYQTVNNKCIAQPVAVLAEREALGTVAPTLYLRLNPMPGTAYGISYTARLAPPVITQANIWTADDPSTDPGVSAYLPNVEAVLLPFALQRWTAHPSFSAEGAQLSEIKRQYDEAKTLMRKREPIFARTRAIFAH